MKEQKFNTEKNYFGEPRFEPGTANMPAQPLVVEARREKIVGNQNTFGSIRKEYHYGKTN